MATLRRPLSLLVAGALCAAALTAETKAQDVDPDLSAIQDHIATFDTPNGFYRTTYRYAEPEYWSYFPKWMRQEASQRKVTRVLDIGCGYGTLLSLAVKIYQAKGYCLDSIPYAEKLARTDGLQFKKSNIELDPIPFREKFDVIIMTEVLEHFNFQPVPTLKKIREALAPGGRFYLSTPDAKTWGKVQKFYKNLADMPAPPTTPTKVIDEHIWVYNRGELTRVVKEAGFRITKLEISNPTSASHFNLILERE